MQSVSTKSNSPVENNSTSPAILDKFIHIDNDTSRTLEVEIEDIDIEKLILSKMQKFVSE